MNSIRLLLRDILILMSNAHQTLSQTLFNARIMGLTFATPAFVGTLIKDYRKLPTWSSTSTSWVSRNFFCCCKNSPNVSSHVSHNDLFIQVVNFMILWIVEVTRVFMISLHQTWYTTTTDTVLRRLFSSKHLFWNRFL